MVYTCLHSLAVLLVFLRESLIASANRACNSSVGVFFSSQELWKTTRRFTVATMRDLGMGKHLGEQRMLEELHFLIELIKSFKGELEMASGVSCYFTK